MIQHRHTTDGVARGRGRFVGVRCVDGLAPDVAERMCFRVEERHMTGVRFYTPQDRFRLDKPEGEPAWRAAALGIPVCVSSGRIGLPLVRSAVEWHPEVPVLIDHMLNPPRRPPRNGAAGRRP